MNYSGITKKGVEFNIFTDNNTNEIIFLDENMESLTWDNTEENMLLVEGLIDAVIA